MLRGRVVLSNYSFNFDCCKKFNPSSRDGQNHHKLMILKSKSNHLNKCDLKSKSFWKRWFENQNHIESQMILKSFSKSI